MTGAELKALRLAWNLTQSQMAKLLGCHTQTISDMEREVKPISQTLEILIQKEKMLRELKKVMDSP